MNYQEGFPKINLANDRQQGAMRDNTRFQVIDQEIAAKDAQQWGDESSTPLSQIIERLIADGGGSYLDTISEIYKDRSPEEIAEAIALRADLVPDGWEEPITSDEQIYVVTSLRGDQYEIEVRVFEL